MRLVLGWGCGRTSVSVRCELGTKNGSQKQTISYPIRLACLTLALCAVCVLPTYNMRTYFLPFAHFVRGSPDPSAWWLLCLPLCLPLCLEQLHPLEHPADERLLLLDAQRVGLQRTLQLRIGRVVL